MQKDRSFRRLSWAGLGNPERDPAKNAPFRV